MNSIPQSGWLIWGALVVVFAAVSWLVGFAWERIILPLASRTAGELDDRLGHAARRPVVWFLFALASLQALRHLRGFSDVDKSVVTPYVEGVLTSLLILAAAWLFCRLLEEAVNWYLSRTAERTEVQVDRQFMPMLRRFMRIIFVFIAATMILDVYDIKVTALLGAAGIASLAVALAAQETFANVIGGLSIMFDRPFRVGDRIETADGKLGDVYEIGMRSTKILTFSRTLMVIPNAEIIKQAIINHSYPSPRVAVRQTLGVSYSSDLEKVRRVLLDIATSHPKVLKDPEPRVYFTEFADSSLNHLLVYSVEHYDDQYRVRDEVSMQIKKRFEEEGIEIPFPQRVVHMKGGGA